MDPSASVRERNLRLLEKAGFRVANSLPLLSSEPVLRPTEEILGRLLALKALWLWVDRHPPGESDATVRELIEDGGLRRHLTPEETEILDLPREDALDEHGETMGWKNENCWSLAWVLGFPDAPAVDVGQVSGSFGRRLMLQWLPNNAAEARAFRKTCTPRNPGEVQAVHDLFYCAHNAVRSAQTGRDTVPESFDPLMDGGCIHERRHALTWALSPGVDWDDTDLST